MQPLVEELVAACWGTYVDKFLIVQAMVGEQNSYGHIPKRVRTNFDFCTYKNKSSQVQILEADYNSLNNWLLTWYGVITTYHFQIAS